MILKLGMDHQGAQGLQVHINDDPGLTLTYFTAMSNLSELLILLQNNSPVRMKRK